MTPSKICTSQGHRPEAQPGVNKIIRLIFVLARIPQEIQKCAEEKCIVFQHSALGLVAFARLQAVNKLC